LETNLADLPPWATKCTRPLLGQAAKGLKSENREAGVVAPASFNDSPQSMGLLDKPPLSSPLATRGAPMHPGMKPKRTKDDTRLMARVLPFFVGMFSLASFFNGDGLLAGARAGVALWLITIGALGYVAFRTLRR
jgi:hypothetical protein